MKEDFKKIDPLHISQAFGLRAEENDLDFFDANLHYDSKLFIDPFLFKTSPIEEENELFKRFGIFFKHAYKEFLVSKTTENYEKLLDFLTFHEPREVGLGYTQLSNRGAGPGRDFANAILNFFLKTAAGRIINTDALYPGNKFNPDILPLLAKRVGPDGISDLTACLMMDYLVEYTQAQCTKWEIPLKTLPVQQAFDFGEMEWTGGQYCKLPENPLRKGEAIVFVPKHLLRAGDTNEAVKARDYVLSYLRKDDNLKRRFTTLLDKDLAAIKLEEIQDVLLRENHLIKAYLEHVESEGIETYDFEKDFLKLLSYKKFSLFYSGKLPGKQVEDCDGLLWNTTELIKEFTEELEQRDGWREMWRDRLRGRSVPAKEESFGRLFRGMGHAYFRRLEEVTFLAETGTGNGYVDFMVIFKDCRITIELKKLENAAPTGEPPIPAYIHGIERQLPSYTVLMKAKHAFYITGQHHKNAQKKDGPNHSPRVDEIKALIPKVTTDIQARYPKFIKMEYVNIDLSPKASASKI